MEASSFSGWPSIILPPHFTKQCFFTWRTMASSHKGKILTTIPCQRIQSLVSWVYLSFWINGSFAKCLLFPWGTLQIKWQSLHLSTKTTTGPSQQCQVFSQYPKDLTVLLFCLYSSEQRFFFSFLTILFWFIFFHWEGQEKNKITQVHD